MTFYRKSTAIPWIIFYRILTVSITEMLFSNLHSLHSRCSILVDAPLKILLCAVFLIQYTQLLTHSIALRLALGQEPVHRGITSTCSLQTSGSMATSEAVSSAATSPPGNRLTLVVASMCRLEERHIPSLPIMSANSHGPAPQSSSHTTPRCAYLRI